MKSAIVYMPNFNLLRKLWNLLNIDELWDNFSNFLVLYFPLHKISGSVLVNDFWTPPPPINFVHDHLFFSKFIIIYFFVI